MKQKVQASSSTWPGNEMKLNEWRLSAAGGGIGRRRAR
jgi:hypothetical protein